MSIHRLAYDPFMFEKTAPFPSANSPTLSLLYVQTKNINEIGFFFNFYCYYFFFKIKYGPRRCAGIGLGDGEGMERLWSYLRRFCRVKKEMRPSHRIDILSGALEYYGTLKKNRLGICHNDPISYLR